MSWVVRDVVAVLPATAAHCVANVMYWRGAYWRYVEARTVRDSVHVHQYEAADYINMDGIEPIPQEEAASDG